MAKRINPALRSINWLKHRYEFTVVRRAWVGSPRWEVLLDQCTVSRHEELATAQAWIEAFQPISLADLVAMHPECGQIELLICGASGRLARIPEPFWSSYDAVDLTYQGRFCAISAKARSMFPDERAIFVRGSVQRS